MTMTYRIISPRIGVPGDIYEPTDDTNIAALIDGGFIEQTGTTKGAKSARKDNSNEAPDAHHNIEE